MSSQQGPRAIDLRFRSSPSLCNVLRASPAAPLPIVVPPIEPPSPPPPPDPLAVLRAERQTLEQALAAMRQSVERLSARYDALAGEMRQATVELATAIAGKFVFDKLHAGEFPIEEMVRQALTRLPPAPSVTVYLHPEDLALMRRRLADPAGIAPEDSLIADAKAATEKPSLRLEADQALPRGGCRAVAGEIHVLADLAASLAELRSHLLGSAIHAQSGSDTAAP
jgi:flagellar biosynthesis/type III secretory pathway protein FliH